MKNKCNCPGCYLNKSKVGTSCKIQYCSPGACATCMYVMTKCSSFITEADYLKQKEEEKKLKAQKAKDRKKMVV